MNEVVDNVLCMLRNFNVFGSLVGLLVGLLDCFQFHFPLILNVNHSLFHQAFFIHFKRFFMQHVCVRMQHKGRWKLIIWTARADYLAPVCNELDMPFACNLAFDRVVKTGATIAVSTIAVHDPNIDSALTANFRGRGSCCRGRCCGSCLNGLLWKVAVGMA